MNETPRDDKAAYSPRKPATSFREEHDLLGNRKIPRDALYGIHTDRAVENFPLAHRPVNRRLIHAFGAVKLACLQTNNELGMLDDRRMSALAAACEEMMDGQLDEHILVDALQGGAGTSTNMNVNEVLANRALQILGCPCGSYDIICPTDDVNRHQSTNDTYPTALKVAAIGAVRELEEEVVGLVETFQDREREFAEIVKIARTQLQDAVLTTLGREMSAYSEAFSRDRWRVYKCEERLRVVNLGGTAIGTGLGAPRQYIFKAVERLREITGIGLARAENLIEATQNADVFVEVSGILKALAASLMKCSNDLRLLSSGPAAGIAEIRLPERQAGSSIMPGKVNPVICEAVAQVSIVVSGNDMNIFQAVAQGNLDLSQFLPLVADSLLGSIDLLINACRILRKHCVSDIQPNIENIANHVQNSTAIATSLVEQIGYEHACLLAEQAKREKRSIREIAVEQNICSDEEFEQMITPQRVTQLGSRSRHGKDKDTMSGK